MDISRRVFLCGLGGTALSFACGCASNPAPAFESSADRTLALPSELAEAGSQVKVKLPGELWVLVWRTKIGFGASSLRCTHCGSDLVYQAGAEALRCVNGETRYGLDGAVLQGRARPLRVYAADFDGTRLRILG